MSDVSKMLSGDWVVHGAFHDFVGGAGLSRRLLAKSGHSFGAADNHFSVVGGDGHCFTF